MAKIFISPATRYDTYPDGIGMDNLLSVKAVAVKTASNKNELLTYINEARSEEVISSMAHWINEYKRILGNEAYKARTVFDFS